MLWVILIVLIFAASLTAIVYANHSLRLKSAEATTIDTILIEEASDRSVMASTSKDPIVALRKVSAAQQTIRDMIRRYDSQSSEQMLGVSLKDMLNVLREQETRILSDITRRFPELVPPTRLRKLAGYRDDYSSEEEYVEEEDEAVVDMAK